MGELGDLWHDSDRDKLRDARDAKIERLKAMVKRAGEQLQASTRTMDEARGRIVELERDLNTALAAADTSGGLRIDT